MTPDEWRIANGMPELPGDPVALLQLMFDGAIQVTTESIFVMLLLNMERLVALEARVTELEEGP